MISLLKAKPVFVDVSPVDFNIDPAKIEEKLTSRTRGIIAVSLFGQCANFKEINEIAEKNGIWVLEDGAQSFGAIYDGKRSCSLTDVATTSFFPAKPLGCYGDGGAIFTSDDKLAAKIKMIRSHGQERRYVHKRIGINGRMDTLQAAIVRVKLKHFEEEIVTRQVAALKYSELLDGHVMLPEVTEDNISVWAQYTIGVENRDEVRAKLRGKGIPTAVHYPLILPAQEAFADVVPMNEKFEVAQLLSESVLSLPMHGFITNEEVEEVAKAVIESI
jgi:UDP-2-acetamido-2-deoxy-ribo-hexuluronate aminotransferase